MIAPVAIPDRPQPAVKPQPTAEQKSQVTVERQPVIVHFEFAAATPTKADVAKLEEALSSIRGGDSLHIVGYTDDIGGAAYNARLAHRRAEYVATWLRRHGVKNPMRIEAQGKCCYVAPNDSDRGRAANRRAEIHFVSTRKESS